MMSGLVCVSVAAETVKTLVRKVSPLRALADVVEIRVDAMQAIDVAACCRQISGPLLFTNRASWEGGQFRGSEEQRLAPLQEAVRHRAAYVDLELRTAARYRQRLRDALQDGSTQLILSWHDFDQTPSGTRLEEILDAMHRAGADIAKIVTTAHGPADVLRVLALLPRATELGLRLSCFCMGSEGKISRLATCFLGGYMTYVALNDTEATAPGQFTLEQFCRLQELVSHED